MNFDYISHALFLIYTVVLSIGLLKLWKKGELDCPDWTQQDRASAWKIRKIMALTAAFACLAACVTLGWRPALISAPKLLNDVAANPIMALFVAVIIAKPAPLELLRKYFGFRFLTIFTMIFSVATAICSFGALNQVRVALG